MKRRTYLATAGVLTLSGCMGFGETDGSPTDDDASNDTDDTGNGDGNGTDNGPGSDDDNDGETDDIVEAETLDDFESLSDWRVISGSASAYPDYAVTGSQSVLLEASEAESQVRMARELEEPIDCTDRIPGLAVAAHAPVNIGIQLYDENREKAVYRQRVRGMSIRHVDFGIEYLEGDPDLSEIVEIQISIWTGEGIAEAWIDDLNVTPVPDPTVLLHFDGAYGSHYDDALPLLEEYGYPATAFVPTGRLRAEADHEGTRLTYDEVAAMADAGWTIGSYGAHGNTLTSLEGDRTPESEIGDAREWLEDNGYGDGADFFAYPSGSYDDTVIETVEDEHAIGFTVGYTGHGHVQNPALCPRVVHPDADRARHTLDVVDELGGIATIAFGNLADDLGALEATLEHIDALGLEVITTRELAEEYLL